MNLDEVEINKKVKISNFLKNRCNNHVCDSNFPGWMRKLISMGFIPGKELVVLKKDNKNILVKLEGSKVALCKNLASHIEVSLEQN